MTRAEQYRRAQPKPFRQGGIIAHADEGGGMRLRPSGQDESTYFHSEDKDLAAFGQWLLDTFGEAK